MKSVGPDRLARRRAAAQLLHQPAESRDPAAVAAHICGAQAQEMAAGRLAFRARERRLRAADIDRARTDERSLLRAWVMRGTIHLIATEDARWLASLFAPAMISRSRRRLKQMGLDTGAQDRAMAAIERKLTDDGPTTRPEILEALRGQGLVPDENAKYHFWALATGLGFACLGPDRGAQSCLVLTRDWIGESGPQDREAALAELARRYLGAFGPATAADLARWSGLGLREARTGIASIDDELDEVRVAGATAAALRSAAVRAPREGAVRLLPAWDTYLLGYRDRDFQVDPDHWPKVMPGGGILRPSIVRDGVVIGQWRLRREKKELRVEVDPFEPLDGATERAIAAEGEDIGRFEGLPIAAPGRESGGGGD